MLYLNKDRTKKRQIDQKKKNPKETTSKKKKVKNSMLKLKCHIRKYLLNAHENESSEGEDLKDMRHKK